MVPNRIGSNVSVGTLSFFLLISGDGLVYVGVVSLLVGVGVRLDDVCSLVVVVLCSVAVDVSF